MTSYKFKKKTDPGCHGNEIWDKMGHNLTCMGNITEMFAPSRGFLGWAIERRQANSTTTDPCCHGNQI